MRGPTREIGIPGSIDEVDGAWLSGALGIADVELLGAAPIGAGHMADTFRVDLGAAPWEHLVLKLAAQDPVSRNTAIRHRSYEVEAGFYRDVGPSLDLRIPRCHWVEFDPETGRFAALLDFIGDSAPGDQLAGCEVDQAATALTEIARLHATYWEDRRMDQWPWLSRHGDGYRDTNADRAEAAMPTILERYADRISPDVLDLVTRFSTAIARYDRRGQRAPRTIGHGDFRADNLLFGSAGVWLLDWQTAFQGNGLVDVSYFLGGSLTTADRASHERDLVRLYLDVLHANGLALSWKDCWTNYRRYAFEGLSTAIISAPNVKRNDRGDALFVEMIERAGRHALDLDAESLLDPAGP